MAIVPTYKALQKLYDAKSDQVKNHFGHLPQLIADGLPYEIAIAYVFLKIEQAQNRALYGGVVKIHRCEAEFARRVMNYQHLTRDGFKDLYKNVFGRALPKATADLMADAETTRDKVIHGKAATDSELRGAIADVLEYAEAFNNEVNDIAGFKPLGDMRGFKGRAEPLDKRTSKWLMRGLGFGVKA
ncbi:hypothetical protein [Tepidicella baoligensis]|uniref:hypothetical protein n=1 Tax=Tepidicella baoligensis TaxID=2707016 RepID=UPI0015DB89F8|nr:hypothetical protein [Tepidicella baoligensis]